MILSPGSVRRNRKSSLSPFLLLISGEEFKTEVNALGGYDTSDTGQVVARLGDTPG